MSDKKVVTYPRGFLGYDIGLSIEPKGDTIKDALKNAALNRIGNDLRLVISNKNVEGIWKKINMGDAYVDAFETREKILCNALVAFGCESLFDWYDLQVNNPNQTDLHRRFLNDTLNFILTGKRALNIHSWASVIQVREVTNKDSLPELLHPKILGGRSVGSVSAYDHTGIYQSVNAAKNNSLMYVSETKQVKHMLVDVLPVWVSHKGGFQDLAGTLHVLFGDYGVK